MAEQQEIAIKIEGVYKDFRLPHEQVSSIKSIFAHMFSYLRKHRKYETQHALQDISFEVKKGEFFGIVGRNGSGKSTLLKMLAGIYQPNKGNIKVNGRLVPFIELGVGFNGELTGRENVYLNGALLGFTKKIIDEKYDDIVAFAELERFMDQKLKNYSSGMQVRLAFSLAIRAETDILLVDEVLAVGDADFQRKCFDYFRTLKKNKKTVVFVTHDMNAVREYCDRAIMIEKSRLILKGAPDVVALKYSKMFMENKEDHGKKTQDDKRWGDGRVKYSSVKVTPQELKKEKKITITTQAEAYQTVEHPIFGFVIKNAAGQHILGTNTKIKHKKIDIVKKGDRLTIQWETPHIFGDGTYYIDVAVQRDDGTRECDWWEEAASFIVYKEERTPYIITPDVSVFIQATNNHE